MKRKQIHDSTHLTLEERKIIQAGIENNSTKASIARTIGKDATTIAKEIRKHHTLKLRNTFNRPVLCAKLECNSTKTLRYFENRFEKYDLVIADELGYTSFDREGTDLLIFKGSKKIYYSYIKSFV